METNETSVNIEEVAETQTEEVATQETPEQVAEETSVTDEVAPHQSDEENAKYAEVRRKAEEKARLKAKQEVDSKFAELFKDEFGIESVDDYLEAIQKQREQDRINKLIEQNVPEEYAKEMIENKKFRERYETELKQKQEEAKRLEELKEFQLEYPDVKLDEIPKEVYEQISKGKTLLDAYSRYEVKALKDQLAQLTKAKENSASSTGSVTGNGQVENDFISQDTFEAKKNDRSWVIKNLEKITKSRAKW